MQTVYVLLPEELADQISGNKSEPRDIFPEDVPDPWSGSENAIAIPKGTCLVYKDDLAAKSDCQLAKSLMNVNLQIVQLNVAEGRLLEIKDKKPDPSARFLTSGIRIEDFVSVTQS